MAHSLKRSFAAVSIAVAATFGVTACGTATLDGGTGTLTQHGPLTKDNFTQVMNDAQLKAKTVHMTMEQEVMNMATTLSGDVVLDSDPKKVAMNIDMDSMGMAMKMIVVDGKAFVDMGEMTSGKYLDLSAIPGADEEFTAQLEAADPMASTKALENAIVDFKVSSAPETIDGVEAYRYDLTLDGAEVMKAGAGAAGMDMLTDAVDTVNQVMWVTAEGLPVRVEQNLSVEVAGQSFDTASVVKYSDWGKTVDITAPSGDQLLDPSQLGF